MQFIFKLLYHNVCVLLFEGILLIIFQEMKEKDKEEFLESILGENINKLYICRRIKIMHP